MAFGPIELVVIGFPGSKFKGEIIPALKDLVQNGTIGIIDFVFVMKDDKGKPTAVHLSDYDSEAAEALEQVLSERTGLIGESDVDRLVETLDNRSSAALMLFENIWAAEFVESILRAEGELVMNERIPRAVIQRVIDRTPASERKRRGLKKKVLIRT